MAEVQSVPEGYHTVTPYLVADGAAKLLDFVKQVFAAEETFRMDTSEGAIAHAEVQIGDSVVMLADVPPDGRVMPGLLHVYVEDCDKTYRRALEAGASSVREPADQFYGDRTAVVEDAFGNQWSIATHVEDVPPDEMAKRAAEAAGG